MPQASLGYPCRLPNVNRPGHRLSLAGTAAAIVLAAAGCGATAEPEADTFYTEHAGEAARASRAVARVVADVAALPPGPSRATVDALAVHAFAARRSLLAAVQWKVIENGEEESVSQAEREVNEGAGALLKAMTAIRQYADTGDRVARTRYQNELGGGRERWDQGLLELWHVSRRSDPPKI
jgi:hypothetical protein